MINGTLTSGNTTVTANTDARGNALKSQSMSVKYGGTFSAVTVSLESRAPGTSTWTTITDSSKTAVATFIANVGHNEEVRAVISGADGSDSVDVTVQARATG